jgi:hypothetical protein
MAVLDPADFGAGCILVSPVAEGPRPARRASVSSENSWPPLRPSTHTLAHALTSRDLKIGKCPVRVNQNVNVVILRPKGARTALPERSKAAETVQKSERKFS